MLKRLAALPLLLLVVMGTGAALAPAPAAARCAVVAELGIGLYDEATCNVGGGTKEFSKVKNNGGNPLGGAVECAEVEEFATETGKYTEQNCANQVGEKRWVKVIKANRFEWTVANAVLIDKGISEETVTPAVKAGTEFTFESKILGSEFVLKAKKLNGESTKIVAGGTGSGVFSFSELSVSKPAGCTATSPLKTNSLKTELVEVKGTLYNKFAPASGETLANVVITGCAIAGSYPLKGTVYGQAEPIFTELTAEPLTFSKAINEAAGGSLTLGKEAATMAGAATYSLSGGNSGQKFGAR